MAPCSFQAHHQDILSHQHVLDSLAERAQSLSQTTSDSRVARLLSDITKQYTALCATSGELLRNYELAVGAHQQYQDAVLDMTEWLAGLNDKVLACSDATGDRYAIQNKLDRLDVSDFTLGFSYWFLTNCHKTPALKTAPSVCRRCHSDGIST